MRFRNVVYLSNVKSFGMLAMTLGSLTLLFNILSFHENLFFMFSKSIPSLMLILIGSIAYRQKVSNRVEAVVVYVTYIGFGLFASGILLYYFYYNLSGNLTAAWEYIFVAPLGFILMIVGLRIAKIRKVSDPMWRLLQVLFISLTFFTVFELINTLRSGDILFGDHFIKIIRDIFQIGNAILLYLTLSEEIKGRTRIHRILDLIPSIPSRK